jgi:hypothetical protein
MIQAGICGAEHIFVLRKFATSPSLSGQLQSARWTQSMLVTRRLGHFWHRSAALQKQKISI